MCRLKVESFNSGGGGSLLPPDLDRITYMATRSPMPTFGVKKQLDVEERPARLPAKLLLPPELPVHERRNKSVKIKGTRFQPPKPGEVMDNVAKVDGALLSISILQKLRSGKTYLDISQEYSLSPKDAFDAVVKALQAFAPDLANLTKEVKDMELHKLDALEQLAWKEMGPDAEKELSFDSQGNMIDTMTNVPELVDVVLRIQKARRELMGLDAAKRMETKHEEIRRMYIGVDPDSAL